MPSSEPSEPSEPIVLSPATPPDLLSYIIAYQRHPTTILIGWPRQAFVNALVEHVQQQLSGQRHAPGQDEEAAQPPDGQQPVHPLQHASLLHTAVSRHIRLAFIPTVTHLRAYLAVFSASDSKIPAPPIYQPHSRSASARSTSPRPPLLLVYGFLKLHRDGSEWSAQGIGTTAAGLIEAAARNSFRAATMEPRGALGYEVLHEFLDEDVPLLSGSSRRNDGSWSGRASSVRRVLNRWFQFEAPAQR